MPLLDLAYSYDDGKINITGITDNAPHSQPPLFDEVATYDYGINGSKPHAVAHDLITGATYSYDPNGNMISDGTRTIVYNYDNMPTSIIIGSSTSSFIYDGKGERVKKITPGGETVYVGKHYECSAGTCWKYIFAGNTRIAQKISGTENIVYYHPDHLGSTSAMSDSSGNRIEDIQYFPFGEIRSDTGTVSMPHKYTSKELDETGLYYYGARYYNPAMGRFISADIIVPNFSDPQALNRYSYAGNNPLIYIDPTGQFKLKNLFKSVVVGAVGGAVFVFSGGSAAHTLAGLYAGMAAGATGAALAGGGARNILMSAVLGGALGAAGGGTVFDIW